MKGERKKVETREISYRREWRFAENVERKDECDVRGWNVRRCRKKGKSIRCITIWKCASGHEGNEGGSLSQVTAQLLPKSRSDGITVGQIYPDLCPVAVRTYFLTFTSLASTRSAPICRSRCHWRRRRRRQQLSIASLSPHPYCYFFLLFPSFLSILFCFVFLFFFFSSTFIYYWSTSSRSNSSLNHELFLNLEREMPLIFI